MIDYRKYLQPDVVSKISSLEMRARMVVEGFITGLHKSPYHGFSVEFAEHRQYMPGDELRYVDWKVYGRTDRFYIKQYEEETNLKGWIVVDASSSMRYASPGQVQKYDYAVSLAAALSLLMIKQRDAVGVALYDTELRAYLPPECTPQLLTGIVEGTGKGGAGGGAETGTASSLRRLAERIKRRGLVIVLSDFFDDPDDVITALKGFRHKQNEVLALQILDPLERTFDFGTDATFQDMETGEEMVTQPYQIRKAYTEAMTEFTDLLKRKCRENRIDYLLLDTTVPYDVALVEYLNKRRKTG